MSFSRKTDQQAPELLDLRGLSFRYSMSVKSLRRILAGPDGPPHYLPGGKILVRVADFEEWLSRHRRDPENSSDHVEKILAEFRGSR